MDLVENLTLICALLGILLLLLAIALVILYLADQCRAKRRRRRRMETSNGVYRQVANEDCEAAPGLDQVDTIKGKRMSTTTRLNVSKWDAPVKKKLRWKLHVARRKLEPDTAGISTSEDIENKRFRSKSEWDLPSGETDFLLLKERREQAEKDAERDDDFQSQYFDAMDTIGEVDEDDFDDNNDNELDEDMWTDEPDSLANPCVVSKKRFELRQNRRYYKQLMKNTKVKRRVKALRKLDATAMNALEEQYMVDYTKLQQRFEEQRSVLLEQRRKFIKENDIKAFWSLAMQQCTVLNVIIQEWDKPVLDVLSDIEIEIIDENFTLHFLFDSNDFFSNQKLSKSYYRSSNKEWRCEGCDVEWKKKENNVTLRAVMKRKKESGEKVRKWAKRNSFFNFFQVPKGEDPETKQLIKAHCEIGLFIRDTFVPRATSFFLGLEQGRKRRGSRRKTQQRSNKNEHNGTNVCKKEEGKKEGAKIIENEVEKSTFDERNNQEGKEVDEKKDTIEIKIDEPLDLSGRYVLVESENFDAFLRALDVGLVRRKLAAAQRSINVIEQDSNKFLIRTETPVRTTQIEFELEQCFEEQTLDGRVCRTTPSRPLPNVLKLEQKDTKGGKDSEMVRIFENDGTMVLEMRTSDTLCRRIYRREQL